MKKLTKRILALALAGIMLFAMAACGAKAPAAEGAEVPKAENAAPEAETVEIQFTDTMPSETRQVFFEGVFARYEEANPGVKIVYNSIPWDEAYKKLVSMGASNTLPDVFTGAPEIMTALGSSGALMDLTERFENMPSYGDLNAAALACKDTYSHNGKVYAIPDGFLSQSIFVRTDWLEEAGYNVEDLQDWTWDEYDEIARAITNPDEGRFGVSFRGGSNGTLRLIEFFGSMLEYTEVFPYGDNRSFFEDPQALELFKRFYANYVDGYSPVDSVNWAFKEQVEGFANGQCGLLNQTPEVIAMCEESMEEGVWTVLPQPVKPDAEIHSYTWGASGSYMIAENSDVREEAWKFVEWLSSPEINIEYCKAFICAPIYNSAMDDPFFSEGYMKAYAMQMTDPKVAYLVQPGYLSQWGYFMAEFGKTETQKYMTGEQTAEETLANIAAWMRENYDMDVASK